MTVIDRTGVVKALQRTDNAGLNTVKASESALSAKNTSGKVMKIAQSNSDAQRLPYIPGFLLLAGGVPVKDGNEVIGTIGVGGAPSGHLDEICAITAIHSYRQ